MTKTTKMTKRDYFNVLLSIDDISSNEELVNFINHELELLERKNNAIKKPTAKQDANEVLKAQILESMEDDAQYTISEMLKQFDCLDGASNQKVNAMLRQLMASGDIERFEDKRRAYFKKA